MFLCLQRNVYPAHIPRNWPQIVDPERCKCPVVAGRCETDCQNHAFAEDCPSDCRDGVNVALLCGNEQIRRGFMAPVKVVGKWGNQKLLATADIPAVRSIRKLRINFMIHVNVFFLYLFS